MPKLRYNFRLRPGVVAERALLAEGDRCRAIWNQCVAGGKSAHALGDTGRFLTGRDLTAARAKHDWLRKGSSMVQQQTMRTYSAKKAAGQGPRRAKKKSSRTSLQYTRNGFALTRDGRLRLAGGIVIPVVWSRPLSSAPSSVRVYQDTLGHWYASFVVAVEDESRLVEPPPTEAAIGIDWGVSKIATTTTPALDLEPPEFFKRGLERKRKYQRMMARRKPERGKRGSKGYAKAKLAHAKQSRKVARQREDHARKWAREVARKNTHIAVEDFKPRFLAKTTMARKAQDNAVGAVKRELVQHANASGRTVVLVPPAWTTRTCSQCGARTKHPLKLSERTFRCAECGFHAGRDLNAAKTVLAQAGFDLRDAQGARQ